MPNEKPDHVITILLVDDTTDTRENVKKLLGFEHDFKVVGAAGTGIEAVALAQQLRPDIIIMDINMPDMDGIVATTQIVNINPAVGIIIMSVQDDPDYMRRAMLAGAKAFLRKPSSPDSIYNTIRTVYKRAPTIQAVPVNQSSARPSDNIQNHAGNMVVVYSPQGGAGCTTIATNLASSLTRDGVRVLLVDANLQFGDIGVFLNLQARSTLADLIDDADDLDTDYFENVVLTHDSGLKVLMGPARPELAEKVMSNPDALSKILSKIRWSYDFVIVDTSLHLDEITLNLMDMANRIVLVSTPTLASTKNVRFVLDLFEQLNYLPSKLTLVLNRVSEDRNIQKLLVSTERIASFLKHPIDAAIPIAELIMLDAVRKGIPVVASQRDRDKSPVKELINLSDSIYEALKDGPQASDRPLDDQPIPRKVVLKAEFNRWGERL
jgi:pilus assembly protein CpaE